MRPLNTTYHLSRGRALDRSAKRQAAGLGSLEDPLDEDTLRRFVACRWDDKTRAAYETAERGYLALAGELRREPDDDRTLALYVLQRVRAGIAAATIKKNVSGILQLRPQLDRTPLVQHALAAADRLADVPHGAKLPLTVAQMNSLRAAIWAAPAAYRDPALCEALHTRDWAFYLLGFVGFFRGAELVQLRWADIYFQWQVSPTEQVESVDPVAPRLAADWASTTGEPPFPLSASFYLPESKTDASGSGQLVCVRARPGERVECPVQLLMWLWQRRTATSSFVFADVRAPRDQPLATDTLRGRLKRYLKSFLPSDVVDRDYALHSLRRGGATAAVLAGIPIRLIKRQGRWRSDVAYLYTLVSDSEALELSERLLSDLAA